MTISSAIYISPLQILHGGVPLLKGHNTEAFGAYPPPKSAKASQRYAIVHQFNKMINADSEDGQNW